MTRPAPHSLYFDVIVCFQAIFARDEESGEDDELDEEDDEFRPGESDDGEAENDDGEEGSEDGSVDFDADQGKCLVAIYHYTTAIQFGEKFICSQGPNLL